jgi:integrase
MIRSELSGGNLAGWTIPGTRTKNHLEFLVPLSQPAREVIGSAPTVAGKPGYVFTTTGRSSVSGFSRMKRRLDAAMLKIAREETGDPEFAIKPWRVHDLRRTFSTNMHALKIAPHIVEACLNHISGHKAGVAGTYNRYEYLDEKHDAVERWARWIEPVTERDLYEKHERHLNSGNDETKKQAKKNFIEAIAEGGNRWTQYLAILASANVVPLQPSRAVRHDL